MTDHFHNFAPADAVQYDGTNINGFVSTLGGTLTDDGHNDYLTFITSDSRWLRVEPKQWLVRQGSRVWVQDEEPPRVERWESEARSGCQQGKAFLEYRRPVLSNGWTGPWSPVDGGAE